MTTEVEVTARELSPGDVIDLRALIEEMTGEYSRWRTFKGSHESDVVRMRAVKRDADDHPATVTHVESQPYGFMMIHTDQLNFTIPGGYRFDKVGD